MMKDIHGRRIICTHQKQYADKPLHIYIYICIQWHIFDRLNVNDEITSESNCHLHLLYNFRKSLRISHPFESLWPFFANLPIFTSESFTLLPRSNHQGTLLPRSEAETPPTSAMSPGISSKKKRNAAEKLRIWRDGSLASRSFHYFFQLPKNLWRPNVPTFDVSCRRFCLPQAMAVQSIQFGANQSTSKIQRACVRMRQILVYKWNPYPFWACNWTTWMQTACHVQNNSWNRTFFCTLLDLCVSSLHSGAMLIFSVSFSTLSDDPSANWQAR